MQLEWKSAVFDCGRSLGVAVSIPRPGKCPLRYAVRSRLGRGEDQGSKTEVLRAALLKRIRRKVKRYSRL